MPGIKIKPSWVTNTSSPAGIFSPYIVTSFESTQKPAEQPQTKDYTDRQAGLIPPTNNNLRHYIDEAFDEGFASPYDLKNSIVTRLTNEATQKGIQVKTSQPVDRNIDDFVKKAEKFLTMYLPKSIANILKKNSGVYLCGGSLLRLLCLGSESHLNHHPAWKNSDWDLFCTNSTVADSIQLNSSTDVSNEYLSAQLKSKIKSIRQGFLPDNSRKVQVIVGKYAGAQCILEDFDLTVASIALWGGADKFALFYHHISAMQDIKERKIRLTENGKKSKMPWKVINRIKKYVARGFIDTTGYTEGGLWSETNLAKQKSVETIQDKSFEYQSLMQS